MDDSDIKALERIIQKDGDCMELDLCKVCPFRPDCWTSFATEEPMQKIERVNKASDILINRSFFPDE